MKEHDFLSALGKVPQEMLDELAQWQSSGTPLTDHLPELDSADPATEPVTQPEIIQRRNKPMKQMRKQKSAPVRLRPWTVGIGAAMAACLVAAVSVGREAIGRQDSIQPGYSDLASEISVQDGELIEVTPFTLISAFESFPVSEAGTVRMIRNADDAAALLNDSESSEMISVVDVLNEEILAEYDAMIIGYRADLYPTDICAVDFREGTLTAEGSLSVDLGIVTANELPENMDDIHFHGYADGNFYLYCAIPKGSLPEITDFEVTFTEFSVGDLPDDIMENPNELDVENNNTRLGVYIESHTAYQEYLDSMPTPRYIRKLPAKQEVFEEIAIEKPGWFNGDEIAVPEGGLVQVVRNMDDAAPLIDALAEGHSDHDMLSNSGFTMSSCLNEDMLAEYDLLVMGYQAKQLPAACWQIGYHDGTVTADGSITLDFSVMTITERPEELKPNFSGDYNYYWYCLVPKDSVPEITKYAFHITEYAIGDLPEDVMNFPLQKDPGSDYSKIWNYIMSQPAYYPYEHSVEGQRYLRKLKPDVPEYHKEIVEAEPLPEPISAFNWDKYRGNDLSIPAEGIVTVIRTAEDARAYRTFGNQRDEWLQKTLSSPWLSGDDETEPHDVIFIGMPANRMPDNTVHWDYHAGTVTPSGKLHLDFSVLSLTEMPGALDYDSETNFYYFISVPKGALPEITAWDVTFTEYRSDAYPDAGTLAKPNTASEAGGNTPLEAWLCTLSEYDNYMYSVLSAKYINWAYDDAPNTVEAVGAVAFNLDVPVSRGYGNVIGVADAGHAEAYLNYVFDQESSAYAGVADTLEGYRALRDALDLGNLELVVDRSEQVDVMMLVLPVYAAGAPTAITDLQVSADGVLSVTLNEYYKTDNVDLSQDTAAVVWQVVVPHGSVPKIKAINLNRNLVEYVYSVSDKEAIDSDLAFIRLAGRMITVQLTDGQFDPASAINTQAPEDGITDDRIEEIPPTE